MEVTALLIIGIIKQVPEILLGVIKLDYRMTIQSIRLQ